MMARFIDTTDAAHAPADQIDGVSAPVPFPLDSEEMKRRTAFARDVSASFGQLVSLLMRSPQHRFTMLSELEWMVMPALVTRQFRVAEGVSQDKGLVAPIAAVMWAHVNADIDRRLSENLNLPIKLKPDEWRSGEHTWIIEAIGDGNAVGATLQHLKQNELKDRVVRMRVRGKDGKTTVGRLELQPAPPAASASGTA